MADVPAPEVPAVVPAETRMVSFVVDGVQVEIPDTGISLLAALRGGAGVRSPKPGCNPQGQCGCCTVLVDGAPRVACVTPLRRIAGRSITTVDGLDGADRDRWADAFLSTGASQCGYCTPGIICRLEGLRSKGVAADDRTSVDKALAAHLCRCTGWQTIREAWAAMVGGSEVAVDLHRDLDAASRRASIEGHADQRVSAEIALGRGGFAEDTAPRDALVAVPDGDDGWVVAASLPAARELAGKIQGRHGTTSPEPPIERPEGEWELELRTSWVEPAYLETDASWCEPGGEPFTPIANGGAFGGKLASIVGPTARALADEHGRAVRVVLSREDVVRMGPKRPPIAAGVRSDGTGIIRVVRTEGIAESIALVTPGFVVEEIDAIGPSTSSAIRGAGWVEAAVLRSALAARAASPGAGSARTATVTSPAGATASVSIVDAGSIAVELHCGEVLDAVVLRSYVIGAVHMALGWVTSEGLSVDADGSISDLTIRSFGVVRAAEMPNVDVVLHDEPDVEPVNGSDAVFAATAAAVWSSQGWPAIWPTGLPLS